jgi:hypothetical protein
MLAIGDAGGVFLAQAIQRSRLEDVRKCMIESTSFSTLVATRALPAAMYRRAGLLAQVLLYAATTAIYLWFYWHNPARPVSSSQPGWIGWFDQGFYYKAALAWAHGNLDPAQHWYLPGYTLFAAPFAALMPLHAFLLPDLIALLAATWLFGRLAERVAPELPSAGLVGSVVFFVCSVALPTLRDVWVVPNSSSLSTPIIYAALLSTVLFCRDGGRPVWVFLAALACCALAGMRPSDSMAPTVAAAAGIGVSLLIHRGGVRRISLSVVGGLLGAAVIAGTLGLAYYALYGTAKSGYVQLSMMLGFEWRLLPLRWVLLVLDPRPVLADGKGLIEGFPWIVPGMAGCAAALVVPAVRARGLRLVNAVVVGGACLHVAIYLCYRDLHPGGLFQFSNFHYFKWVLPVMALYAVRFGWALAVGPQRVATALVGVVPLVILLPWRISLDAVTPPVPLAPSYSGLALNFTADFNDVHNVLMVPTNADPGRLYGGGHSLDIGGRNWGFVEFRAYPQPGGFMLTPLRPLGAGPAVLKLEPGTGAFRTSALPVLARQNIVFGVPCLVWSERRACGPTELIPPVMLPASGVLTFDGEDLSALPSGWSYVELSSRFTDGRLATMRFRVPAEMVGRKLKLEMIAGAYQPLKTAQLRARMQVNGVEVAQWKFPSANRITVSAEVPAGAIGADGIATLALRIDNPRSRRDYDVNSNDTRALGLLVNQVKLTPTN